MPGHQIRLARENTDALFQLVRPDTLYERPVAERHRLIFYLGHLEAFDWNLIARTTLDRPAFHPAFDKLFAFGIDPDPGNGPSDVPRDWPGIEEVRDYCLRVRRELDPLFSAVPEQLQHVALEHRLMHSETLAYLLHNLPYSQKLGESEHIGPQHVADNPLVDVPAGCAQLGLAENGAFGWDNEFTAHRVPVPAFRISRYKITNGEYLEFVREGAAAPHFWVERNGEYFYRGMFQEFPLPLAWPVYVTHEEATAYATWRGAMLPTEEQWHRAAEGARPVNVDFARWDPVAVNTTPEGNSIHGVAQMAGNGWEWTRSVFGPFPGFTPFPFYRGYSSDFFDGGHYVMKGGSPRTAMCMMRESFRNWFRPNYPYVYASFHLTEAA
jgi:formylglycine-generating enzyme required for sulfatase activity